MSRSRFMRRSGGGPGATIWFRLATALLALAAGGAALVLAILLVRSALS